MKKKIKIKRLWRFILVLFFLSYQNSFAEVEFSGFFDSYISIGLNESSGIMALRSDLKTDLELLYKKSSLFFSAKFVKHSIIDQSFQILLKEAYLTFSLSENVEIRAGRQIFSWGNSERIRISDIISPMDFSEYVTMDYNEMKMGIDSILLSFFHKDIKFDLVWSPFFRRSRLPVMGSPWDIKKDIDNFKSYPYSFSGNSPNPGLKNSQLYSKLSLFLKGFDISIYGFSKWNDSPFSYTSIPGDSFETLSGFEKLKGFGIYFSKPVDFLMLRGELIVYKNRFLRISDRDDRIIRGDHRKWMAGVDIFLRNELKFTFQYLFNTVPGRLNIPFSGEKIDMGNINISGKIGDLIRFRNFYYIFFNERGFYNRSEVIFMIDDSFKVITGTDIFKGMHSYFGKYLNNSQIWLKLKYSF